MQVKLGIFLCFFALCGCTAESAYHGRNSNKNTISANYRQSRLSKHTSAYVQRVGQRVLIVAQNITQHYDFFVSGDSTPLLQTHNNTVIISEGILNLLKNEAELAGVIAHELAHQSKMEVVHHVLGKYTQINEMQTDEQTMKYMSYAGYNPDTWVEFQQRMLNQNMQMGYFAKHPLSQARLANNQHLAKQYTEGLQRGESNFRKHVASR